MGVAKLQARLRDLEAELEAEQRRSRELAAANRKMERSLAELRVQSEDDRRMNHELQESVNILTIKIKTLRKQEAEHRADHSEKSVVAMRGRGGNRSMSVTREMVR